VTALETKAAEMFGKESALFVPSGTMGNLISVMIHCQERGSEAILGDKSHIFKYEQGGVSQFGGVHVKVIPNLRSGAFLPDDVLASIRTDDIHYPRTKVLCLENTHNMCGGKVLSLTFLDEVSRNSTRV
jgi:threonine aldolase